MRATVSLLGSEELARTVSEAIGVLGDLRVVWPAVDRHFTERHQRQFETEGALTGGWPPLNTDYLAWKQAVRGVQTSTLVRTGRLRRSLLNPFDPSAFYESTPLSWERGTQAVSDKGAPYPVFHQYGIGVPKREPLVWDDSDNRFVVDEMRKAIGKALNG